ncbi:restriction endonuclease subunit S [Vibrio sp. A2-1]|uniref:restriction endonuclease subunit S n=1 Tax=Vibrio sp. A2-1 TaxID=2912252 RepID=UPI001F0177CA|nr:restriction endonuclease subunit S [Vibrio sp. A2-1]MCF7486252.1 restriction endonuclease subunit S [Vibrio sp. A2-1]
MSCDIRSSWELVGGKAPEHWGFTTLDKLLENPKSVSVGVMYPGKDTLGGIPLIKVSDVKNGSLVGKPEFCISSDVDEEYKRTRLNGTELLITLVGNPGDCVLVTEQMKGWNAARALAVVRLKEPELREWLRYVLLSKPAKHIIDSRLNTTVQKTLNLKDVKELPIPLPPENEREIITKSIRDIEDRSVINSQINQTLEEMAQAIFKSWFVDFDPVKAKMNGEQPEGMDAATASLFPEKLVESELGELPEGWKLVPVGDLLANAIGGDWGKEVPDEKHTEEVRIVRGTDIPKLHGGAIDSVPVRYVESKKLKTRKLERGDIVIEVSGGSKDQPTGRSLFISDNILKRLDLPSEPASFCRRFKPVSYEIGLLLAVHFQLMYQAGKTWEYQNQSTGISNFQTKYFLEAEHVVIPSEGVLEAFIKQVNPMMDMIHSNQNIELTKLRDTLLPKLLSGEIDLDTTEELVEVN